MEISNIFVSGKSVLIDAVISAISLILCILILGILFKIIGITSAYVTSEAVI